MQLCGYAQGTATVHGPTRRVRRRRFNHGPGNSAKVGRPVYDPTEIAIYLILLGDSPPGETVHSRLEQYRGCRHRIGIPSHHRPRKSVGAHDTLVAAAIPTQEANMPSVMAESSRFLKLSE